MLSIHPFIRVCCAALLILGVFVTSDILMALLIYGFVLALICLSKAVKEHALFFVFFGLPFYLALLLIWVWANSDATVAGRSAFEHANLSWVRVLVSAGTVQFALLPLVNSPIHLTALMRRLSLPRSIALLIASAVLFIPEAHRRLRGILDARKAQGYETRGLRGLVNIPAALMPLVSTLMLSAIERGHFWQQRGLTELQHGATDHISYSVPRSVLLMIAVTLVFGFPLLSRLAP